MLRSQTRGANQDVHNAGDMLTSGHAFGLLPNEPCVLRDGGRGACSARLDCYIYSTATLTVSDIRCGRLNLPCGGFLMPFGTNYLRMKADEYRALAAAMTDGAIRLQLLNMAQRYDQEAEHNERQHQLSADKAATSR